MPSNKYEFQWGERCSMLIAQIHNETFGPYYFGSPKVIDYVIVSENRYCETFTSIIMTAEWKKMTSTAMFRSNQRATALKSSARARQKMSNFFRLFNKTGVASLKNQGLFSLLIKLYQHISIITMYFSITQPPTCDALLERLRQALLSEGLEQELPLLITQTVPDILAREQHALALLGKRKNVTDAQLLKHAITYPILFYNSYDTGQNIAYLRGRLKEGFDWKGKLNELKKLRRRQEHIFRKIKNKQIKNICLFFQAAGVDRLELKNCWAGAEFRFLPLFKEIAKRSYLPLPTMMAAFTLDDYRQALIKGREYGVDQLNKRISHFVLWKKGNISRLLETPEAMRPFLLLKKSLESPVSSDSVTGIVANGGKARGVVRIVQSLDIQSMLKDLERFNQGDVLVTWMTQPNMVPIARKAAAIIADEGGITSHAAVIAREFGVPCIVGTKKATKIFKDGDKVEVNAELGVIRKI